MASAACGARLRNVICVKRRSSSLVLTNRESWLSRAGSRAAGLSFHLPFAVKSWGEANGNLRVQGKHVPKLLLRWLGQSQP